MATKYVNIQSVGPFNYDDTLWYALKTDGQQFVGTAPLIDENVVRLVDLAAYAKTYSEAFTAVTSITILGTTHKITKTDLSITFWDDNAPRVMFEAGSITVHRTTFDVVISFAESQSGRVVLIG